MSCGKKRGAHRTWITLNRHHGLFFLKYLDDLESERAMEAELVGKNYDFIIKDEYTLV
jgi:hypothetical protein